MGRQALEQALGVRQQKRMAEQEGMLQRLKDLVSKEDWRGLVAMEDEAGRVARQAPLHVAGVIYGMLGYSYQSMGEYARAIALHEEHKKIAEEVGDRAEVGMACGSLGICYESMGEYARAIALHAEGKKISEEIGDRAGVGQALSLIHI